MAKRKPTLTLVEMERELGYQINSLTHPTEAMRRFYSDLRPVPDCAYEKTKKELEERAKNKYRKDFERTSEKVLPDLDDTQIFEHDQDTIALAHRRFVGLYRFAVDIHYGFGFHLPLLFTEDEATRTMSVAKLRPSKARNTTSVFFNLPREIRDKIYIFALPEGSWSIRDVDNFNMVNFLGSIGDPSGFYFPLSKNLVVLRVNRQMRQEALPLAYHSTIFRLDDMDDLVKLLIAVGQTGRNNIESLEFSWESRTDLERNWDENPEAKDHLLMLPTTHVNKCVQLLKQCKRLRFLRIYFESEQMLKMAPDAFKADPGIQDLSSVRGMKRVEIWSLDYEPLGQCYLAKWLKEEMEGLRRVGGSQE